MDTTRRDFLRAAGFTVVGAGTVVSALAGASSEEVSGEGGPRWAMVVDLKKCQKDAGCNRCREACHSRHNVPDLEDPRHEIKWIWKAPFEHVFPGHVGEYYDPKLKDLPTVVMCNHCDNPPCVRVCPTRATFRRADGVVVMDPHRCIGCRYCIVGCPYGSRSFNFVDPWPDRNPPNKDYPTRMRGVVEKCTLCPERIAAGEVPYCVEACEKAGIGALTFGDIADPNSAVRKLVESSGRTILRRKPELGTRPQVYYLL